VFPFAFFSFDFSLSRIYSLSFLHTIFHFVSVFLRTVLSLILLIYFVTLLLHYVCLFVLYGIRNENWMFTLHLFAFRLTTFEAVWICE
jgi:hypothetical protein